MATTTRVVLLQRLSEAIGDWWSAATTGAGSTTTVVDTKLAQLSADDDFCIGYYVRKVATDEVRKVTAYVASTTTITHVAFPAAVGNGNTYELHRYDPTDKHNAINRAIEELFSVEGRPVLYLPIRDETLVVNDLLVDTGYEKAISGGAFPDWTNSGSPTVTAETTRKFHGAQSAKVVAGGAAGQIYQEPTINIRELTSKTASFRRWVYATATSAARLRLDWDGTAIANSSYHTGKDQWERLEVQAAIPSTATRVRAICEVAASQTAYFDAGGNAGLFIDRIKKYTIPTSILVGPQYVLQQANLDEPDGSYYPVGLHNRPVGGAHLRIEGIGLLSRPTTDAGTVEVGAPRTNLIVAYATMYLYRIMGSLPRAGALVREGFNFEVLKAQAEIARLAKTPGVRMPLLSAQMSKGVWHVEEDSTGRFLVLDQ